MKASEIDAKIRAPHINVPVEVNGKIEQLECPQITIGDWKDIKAESPGGFDQWSILLKMSSGMDERALAGKSKKEKEEIRNQSGLDLFAQIDQSVQLAMFSKSLKHNDPEITEEQVDRIISYGITDKNAYVKALMFLLQGVKPEDIEEAQEDDNPLAKAEATKDAPTKGGQ